MITPDTKKELNDIIKISHKLIIDSSIQTENFITWSTTKTNGQSHSSLYSMGIDFYKGLSGVLHYFNHFIKINPCKHSTYIKNKIINTIYEVIFNSNISLNVGGYTGIGGILYSLSHLPEKHSSQKIKNLIEEIIKMIDSKLSFFDDTLDVIGGSAGLIIVLSNNCVDYKDKIYLIEKLSDHILRSIQIENNNIKIGGSTPLLGYSHGLSGIALALILSGKFTKSPLKIKIAKDIVKFENSFFNETFFNWPDLRYQNDGENNAYSSTWCHGNYGICMSRIAMYLATNDKCFLNDISIAIEGMLLNKVSKGYCLCHGLMGNIDFFLLLNQHPISKTIKYSSKDSLKSQLEILKYDLFEYAHPHLVHVDFMTGLSGIAYQSLRLQYPSLIPSPLIMSL